MVGGSLHIIVRSVHSKILGPNLCGSATISHFQLGGMRPYEMLGQLSVTCSEGGYNGDNGQLLPTCGWEDRTATVMSATDDVPGVLAPWRSCMRSNEAAPALRDPILDFLL